jgi:hypothetical protein
LSSGMSLDATRSRLEICGTLMPVLVLVVHLRTKPGETTGSAGRRP